MCKKRSFLQCRLCLRNKKSMVEIFSVHVDNGCVMKEAIEDLLGFKVLETDLLPRTICGDCCSKVMGFKSFKAMCMKSKEILWRKALEGVIDNGRTDISSTLSNLLQLAADDTTCSSAVVKDGHYKKEPCEGIPQEMNLSGLLCDNVQSIECNERVKLNQIVEEQCDNNSMSSVSTLVRSNGYQLEFDEESLHLILESSSSEISESDCRKLKAEILKPSSVKEKTMSISNGYTIPECSVVLTRCDIDKYNASKKCSNSSNKTDVEEEGTGHKSHNGPPYPCSDCWITFSSLAYLLNHKKYCRGKRMPQIFEVSLLNNTKPNEISDSNEKCKEMLNGISGETKEKLDLVKQKHAIERESSRIFRKRVSSRKGKVAEWLKLKKSREYDGDKFTSSNRGSSLEKVTPLLPCSQSNPSLLEERVVKRIPKRGRGKGNENSSIRNGRLNSIKSSIDKQFENWSKNKNGFKCDSCQKLLKKKSRLRVHRHIHNGIKPFSCQVCNQNFCTECIKLRHELIHFDYKPFSCPKCTKAYRHSAGLSNHLKMHSNLKAHKCRECGKAFALTEALRRHKWVHMGEQPFKCKWCPQAFATKGNLTVHSRIHPEEWPYECMDCGKRFYVTTNLKYHLKNVHFKMVSSNNH